MKNVLVVIQNQETGDVVMIKTFDDEKQKYIWSLPNLRFHWNVTEPKKSGKIAAQILYKTFSFGICKEDFLSNNTKYGLPSKNIAYKIQVTNEISKIEDIFNSLKLNNNFKFDIIKMNLQNFKTCLDVKAFSEYHFETIECMQFIFKDS